jgi:SPP1 family predicted phage head-tail adaptor
MSLQYDFQSRKARFSTDPGRLDRRVTLQYAIVSQDAVGGVVQTWINAPTVWASKRFESGRRLFVTEQKTTEDYMVFRIRHRLDVDNFWRIVHGDDVFEVVSIEELGRRQYLDLTARAVGQSTGSSLNVLLIEDNAATNFLQLEDGTPLLLEDAA